MLFFSYISRSYFKENWVMPFVTKRFYMMNGKPENSRVNELWTNLLVPTSSLLKEAIAQLWVEEEPKLHLASWLESKGYEVAESFEKQLEDSHIEDLVSIENGWLFLKSFETRCLSFIQKMKERFTEKKETILDSSFDTASLRSKQLEAVHRFLKSPLFVLTGGPGTGKTYTCRRLVEALVRSEKKEDSWRVLLLAPTGKAMVRLQQSMQGLEQGLEELIPLKLEAMTLHRFLYQNRSKESIDLALDPAAYDLVLVDESSMVTMALFEALLVKVHPRTRLVFIGDPYQLPPVQSMPVFAKLVKLANLAGSCIHLDECLRIENTQLYNAAHSLSLARDSDQKSVFKALFEKQSESCSVLSLENFSTPSSWVEKITENFPWISLLKEDLKTPEKAFKLLNQWVCLCSVKSGVMGSERINQVLYERMRFEFLKNHGSSFMWIPVMATVNQKELARVNGEMGVMALPASVVRATPLLSRALDKATQVLFQESQVIQSISALRLNTLLPAWAMTVHKSQGSEFDHVECLLSPSKRLEETDASLLYTACTRAKKSLRLWTKGDEWESMLMPSHQIFNWMDHCEKKAEAKKKPSGL